MTIWCWLRQGRSAFNEETRAVISYLGLRKTVGAIGMLLPVLLVLGGIVLVEFLHDAPIKAPGGLVASSMSAYYYTDMRNVFIGSMCAFGVFLLAYRYGRFDGWLGNLAGASAIVVGLCPTKYPGTLTNALAIVHLSFAVAFFVFLAVFCIFRFPNWPLADWRDWVYTICGALILISIVLAVIVILAGAESSFPWVLIFEWLGVWSFGVAWFVVGLRSSNPDAVDSGFAGRY
jgi:hypothetical protein